MVRENKGPHHARQNAALGTAQACPQDCSVKKQYVHCIVMDHLLPRGRRIFTKQYNWSVAVYFIAFCLYLCLPPDKGQCGDTLRLQFQSLRVGALQLPEYQELNMVCWFRFVLKTIFFFFIIQACHIISFLNYI